MNKEQFKKITKWQQKTFGHATALSKMTHLTEEIVELHEALADQETKEMDIRMEFADCFILLFGAASSHGMTYGEICTIIDKKMKINYKRKWGKVQPNGVVHHIKPK